MFINNLTKSDLNFSLFEFVSDFFPIANIWMVDFCACRCSEMNSLFLGGRISVCSYTDLREILSIHASMCICIVLAHFSLQYTYINIIWVYFTVEKQNFIHSVSSFLLLTSPALHLKGLNALSVNFSDGHSLYRNYISLYLHSRVWAWCNIWTQ